MPKKKKKGGDKEKKARKKLWVNERETVSYEQQILDNNKQLARLRSRNEHLEGEVEALKGKLLELEDDRSDVVAHLKRILEQKTEESRELSDRLLAMEELRKDEQTAYKKKEDAMQLEYNTMENNLTAEVKLAAGKLNALEDWRLARIDLMRKFEIQEEQMAEQEERHKQQIYEAEKSLIIGKAKMQKEMEERLNDLAKKFREATNIRIAEATHRAIRENVALNVELDAMYKICRELEIRTSDGKEKEQNLRLHASLFQSEAQMALKKLSEQNRLIDDLAEQHFDMSLVHGKICRRRFRESTKEPMIRNYREKSEEVERKSRILEQNVQKVEIERNDLETETRENCGEIERLREILGTAQRYIEKMYQMQAKISKDCVCTPCDHNFNEKLHVLLNLLENREINENSLNENFSLMEKEYSDESFEKLGEDSSVRVMQTGTEHVDETIEDIDSKSLEQFNDADDKINQQYLSMDYRSSDANSTKETESASSKNSKTD